MFCRYTIIVYDSDFGWTVPKETEVVFAAAVREAEAAGVSGPLVTEADAWLGRIAALREAGSGLESLESLEWIALVAGSSLSFGGFGGHLRYLSS